MKHNTIGTTYDLDVEGLGPIDVTATDRGQGQPFLLLHGGAGPQSVSTFADLLAEDRHVRVITPTHPGFDGTVRPETLRTITGLAKVQVELLNRLDLEGVTVIGNSIGGWIAAEMALLGSPRISGIVLVSAVGIQVEGHPVADFFSLTMDQVADLSYHDPDSFRIDVRAMPLAQQRVMAGNRAALAVYGGTAMLDPTLRSRLAAVDMPTLALWGTATGSSTPTTAGLSPRPIPAPVSSSSRPQVTFLRSRRRTNCGADHRVRHGQHLRWRQR